MRRWLAPGALAAFWVAVLAAVLPYLLAGRVTSPASASPGGEREGRGGGPITIAFAGDITPGSRYGLPPERARPMVASWIPNRSG